MSNPVDDLGNVQVDFVWGNMPMQPDDARGENTLDPALDNHIIATSGYEGFPAFIVTPPYDDTIANVSVPNVVGNLLATAQSTLTAAGLTNSSSTTYVGATTTNDGKVKSSTPAAATIVNTGTNVALSVYAAPTVPNVLGDTEGDAETALIAAHLVKGAVTTSATGATTVNDGTVKTQTPVSGGKANTGSSVALVLYAAPTVPDVLGLDETTAEAALISAGLIKGTVTTSGDGATAENDGLVKSQTPVSGGKADTGSAVDLVLFDYVAP